MPERVIKICGVRSADHALAVAEAGATAIGLMFAPSKRQVGADLASAIAASLPRQRPDIVGVFVNESPDSMLSTRGLVNLDVVQLSGDEPVSILAELSGSRVWKALRFDSGTAADTARRIIDRWVSAVSPPEVLLVDAAVNGAYGGTGHRADWDLVATLASEYPIVLAGGLHPLNVRDAIDQVQPTGVDVSSGVESFGHKDPDLIQSFVQRAHAAFHSKAQSTGQ